MNSFTTRKTLVTLACFAILWTMAHAAEVTSPADTGPDTLRYIIQTITQPNQTVTIRPGVNPVLDAASGTINVAAPNLTVSGNASGGQPRTTITVTGTLASPLLRSTNNAGAGLSFRNVEFKNITFSAATPASGQGGTLINAFSSAALATLGTLDAVWFTNNTVFTGDAFYGGGLVGAFAQNANNAATIGAIADSVVFTGNTVEAAGGGIQGGGLVGASSNAATATLDSVSGTYGAAGAGNTVTTKSFIQGGGIIGVYAVRDAQQATLGAVTGSFSHNTVTAGTYLQGGGIIGAYNNNVVSAGANRVSANLQLVDGARFSNNTVFVGADAGAGSHVFALGGVLAASGLDNELTIKNAVFRDNTLRLTPGAGTLAQDMGAAVFVSTDRVTTNPNGHAVTLAADAGKTLEFSGNTTDLNGVRSTGALLFGREWNETDGTQFASQADAALSVDARGRVVLLDPILADLDSNKNFTMQIAVAPDGAFHWGGANRLRLNGGLAAVSFGQGETSLENDYSLRAETHAGGATRMQVSVAADASLVPVLVGRDSSRAAFDFSAAAAGSSLTFADGAVVAPRFDDLTSVTEMPAVAQRYLLVDGLDATGLDGVTVRNSLLATFALSQETGKTWLDVVSAANPTDFYNHSPNAVALAPLVNDVIAAEGMRLNEEQYVALLNDLPNLSQESLLTLPLFSTAVTTQAAHIAMQSSVPAAFATTPADTAARRLASGAALASPVQPDLGRGWRFWTGYFHEKSRQLSSGGYYGYKANANGGLLGATYYFSSGWETGIYGGASKSNLRSGTAKVESDGQHLGAYARFRATNGFAVTLDGIYSHYSNDYRRHVLGTQLSGSANQHILGGGLDVRREFAIMPCLVLSPYAQARVTHYRQGETNDRGSSIWAMRTDSTTGNMLTTTLGSELRYDIILDNAVISPGVNVGWLHDAGKNQLSTASGFKTVPGTATIRGVKADRDALLLGANVDAILRTRIGLLNLRAAYLLDYRGDSRNHRFQVEAGFRF